MSGSICVGVDLASGTRPLGYAALDAGARLIELIRAPLGDDELVERVRGASLVAIDAPLSLPAGMCCFEAACPCAPSHPRGMRTAELAVRAAGIGLYATTKLSMIRRLIERATPLARRIGDEAAPAIETYPFGAKVRLFGRPHRQLGRKSTLRHRAWLTRELRCLVAGLPDRDLHDDEADAVLAAYTALLVVRGEAEPFGDEGEGLIWLPAIAKAGGP